MRYILMFSALQIRQGIFSYVHSYFQALQRAGQIISEIRETHMWWWMADKEDSSLWISEMSPELCI